jgi:phosphatidylglycerol:prolipoprotein diacylglycerol transferase
MITGFPIPGIPLFGGLTLYPFGLLVATGVLAGALLIRARARERGIAEGVADSLIVWAVVPGFIMAHWVAILFYKIERLELEGPLLLLKVWDGISSYGGFIGALIGLLIFARTTLKGKNLFVYSDLLMQGLILGWLFGRLGCTISFDHPGSVTESAIGFVTRSGVARHNLGFYEFLYSLLILFPVSLWIHSRERLGRLKPGYNTAMIGLLYAPLRFVLDFFRSTDMSGSDTRYLGLTFAHYCCLATMVLCGLIIARLRGPSQDAPLVG